MFFFFFQQVEVFVEKMFQYLNIEYKKDYELKSKRIDFVLQSNNNLDILVEVKEVKNNCKNTIISVANQLKYYKSIYPKEKLNKYSFIVILGNVEKEQKNNFKKEDIIIIDIANIIYLIRNNQDLLEQLKNMLPFSIIDIIPQKINLEKYINHVEKSSKEEIPKKIEDEYIRNITNIKKGKEGSREFEIIGEMVIKFLFGDYIYDWKSQINCDNNLHRIDLLGKVKQQEGFWKILYEIYRSRYIIFEFKNYNDEITQEQIDDTNKYLNKNALRTVAILISRSGIDRNSKSICKGILRSEGKLILTLSENDLITMLLNKKENPNKDIPSEYMEKLFDNFLLEVEK